MWRFVVIIWGAGGVESDERELVAGSRGSALERQGGGQGLDRLEGGATLLGGRKRNARSRGDVVVGRVVESAAGTSLSGPAPLLEEEGDARCVALIADGGDP